MARKRESTRLFREPYGVVFDAVVWVASTAMSLSIASVDPVAGSIEASSTMTLLTWGEHLSFRVWQQDDQAAVQVSSRLKFGLVDWGRNGKNVETFFATLTAALAGSAQANAGRAGAGNVGLGVAVPGPGAWGPDPAGRHELRWWDGARWTESVSNAGTVGTDPL